MNDGLCTVEGQSVPLLGVQVQAAVVGGHTRVMVRQRYRNAESKPVEAIYTFPLPSDATISGFAMVCQGRRLEGLVQEKEQAFKSYDEAIAQGHGAALLEEERKNVFTANVGNLLPDEETLIEVEYLQKLSADEGALRWMLPTLVAPRYIPGSPKGPRTGGGWAEPTDAVPDADRITPRIGDVKYGLRLDLSFDVGVELTVESPSHRVTTEKMDGRVRVSFEQPEVALDRDIVIIARGAKGVLAGVSAHREGEGPGFFALTVVPDLFEPAVPVPAQDVVFLVDTSGSMEGESLPQAKAALKLCLRHLHEGDRFNIIQFNSGFSSYVPASVLFSQGTLQSADRWVESLNANGGTELLQPLQAAVRMSPNGVVVLLTDGQVGNEAQILNEVLKTRRTTRVFSFGIGTNVSDQLLRDLATQTDGGVEFIYPGERIDEKVTAQFAKAIAARVTNIELKWVGLAPSELAPSVHKPLVDGTPWTVFGRYDAFAEGHVEIFGRRGDKPFMLSVPAVFPSQATQPALRPLWAAERIADWETAALKGRRAEAMKERITKLAIEYGVSSQHTSFLVVEKRTGDRLAHGQPEARFIPVNRPAGWAMFDGGAADGGLSHVGSAVGGLHGAMSMPPPMAAAAGPSASFDSNTFGLGAPAPAKKSARGAGLVDRLRSTFDGWSAAAAPAQSAPKGAPPSPPAPPAEMEDIDSILSSPGDDLATIFGEQLASGLWDGAGTDSTDLRQLRATTKVLARLVRDGIDTSHAVYGAQIRKAVEALAQLVVRLDASHAAAIEEALCAAWLVARGQRTRATLLAAAGGYPAIVGRLGDEAALRSAIEQMAK